MDWNQLLSTHQPAMMENGTSCDKTFKWTRPVHVVTCVDHIQRLRDHHAFESTNELEAWESEGGSVSNSGKV